MAQAGVAYIDFQGRYGGLMRDTDRAAKQVAARWESQARDSSGRFVAGVGKANSEINKSSSDWGKKIARNLQGAGQALVDTVHVGVTAAGGAMAALGAMAVAAGVDYNALGQRATAAFTTLTGSAEGSAKVMGELMQFASQSPFPRQAFIEAAQQMMAFGFAAEDVVPTLGAVQDAIAASGGSAQQMSEVVYVLSQIQSAGKITATDLMQLGQRGINAAELIGGSLGMSGQQVRESITAGTLDSGEAIQALTDGMSAQFGGAAANLKGTWTGAVDSIQARVRDIGGALMEPFIGFTGGGALTEGLGLISTAFKDMVTTAEDGSISFTGALAPMNEVMQGLADRVLGLLTAFADFVANIDFGSVLTTLQEFAPAIGAIGAALGASIGGQIPILGSFLGGINPVVAAIGGLIAASPELREVFGAALNDIFGAIQPLLGPAMALFEQLGMTILPPLVTILESLVEAAMPILEVLIGVADAMLVALQPAIDALLPVLTELGEVMGEAVLELVEALAPILPELAETFADLVVAVMPLVEAMIPLVPLNVELMTAMMPLLELFVQLVDVLVPVIGFVARVAAAFIGAVAAVRRIQNAVVGFVAGTLRKLPGQIARVATAIWDWVTKTARELPGKIAGWATAFWDWITDLVTSLPGRLARVVGAIVGWVVRTVPKLAEAFLEFAGAALGWIARTLVLLPLRLAEFLLNLLTWIIAAPILIVGWFVTQWIPAFLGWIVDVVTQLPGKLWDIAQAIWNWVSETAVSIGGWVADMATSFWTWITTVVTGLPEKLGEIWNAISSWFSELPDKIAGFAESIAEGAKAVGSAILDGIVSGITGAIEWIGDVAEKLWKAVAGFINDNILSEIKEFEVKIDPPGPGVLYEGQPFGSLPLIPLARGGYFTRPTPALIGEAGPELVLPLDNPKRFAELMNRYAPLQPGIVPAAAGMAVGTPAGVEDAAPDVSGISAWAEAVVARLATLPDEIVAAMAAGMARWRGAMTAWLARLTADLDTWLARTEAAFVAWLARLSVLMTTWRGQQATAWRAWQTSTTTTVRTTVTSVTSMFSDAVTTWSSLGTAAGTGYVTQLTGKLQGGVTAVANIVGQYATKLADGLNPILVAIGENKIALRDGAVVRMAEGGLHERHVAQIARPGAWRVWAEPETGGEAYIPLARSKRQRSRSIASETVRRLGGDVEWFQGGGITGNTAGLHPSFLDRVRQWVAAVGRPFHIQSGYRSVARQAELYADYLAGHGNLAARPGNSMHNFGLAIDGPHWGNRNPGAFGLVYRVRGEPWHVEPVDAQALRGGAAGDAFGFSALEEPPEVPAGTLGEVAAKAMRYVYDKAVAWSAQALANAAGDQSISGGGPGAGQWSGTVAQALRILGQPTTYLGDILTQIGRESGGNPAVVNRWDSNWHRGTPSVGLMQVIGPTYAAHKHPAYDTGPYVYGTSINPLANVLAGLRYSLSRYGDLGHFRRRGFAGYAEGGVVFNHRRDFDRGGVLRPGMNLVANNTGADERLVPAGQGQREAAVAIREAHFHEGVDYDVFLRKTAFMLSAGRI